MVRSITRQGIFTTYDPDTRRMRQKNYDNRVRFSIETYTYEEAWNADDRVDVIYGQWSHPKPKFSDGPVFFRMSVYVIAHWSVGACEIWREQFR